MNKKTIKVAAVTLAVATGLAVVAGCTSSSSSSSGSGGAPTKITMLVLGDKPTNGRYQAMLDVLNPRLTQQVNATLDFYYVEWADWQTQYNTELLSGDSNIDLITTATDWLFAWDNAKKGAFLPLSQDMLQQNAPKTWAQVQSKGDWDVCTMNDQIWFMPEDNYTQHTNQGFFYRGEWAKQAGIPTVDGKVDGLNMIQNMEQFTQYFQWVKANQPQAYPWDAGQYNESVLDGYLQGHTDKNTILALTTGNYYPFQTKLSDPYTITSWFMDGDELLDAANLAKQWNDMGVWRADAINFAGDTDYSEFYSGLSGTGQHHTETFVTQTVYNMNLKQPGSDPQFFYWGEENGNVYNDLKTHGAMAVSANSKNPDLALKVYDLLRNDQTDYMLLNYGIEGTDYVIDSDGKLTYPANYDPTTDALGTNFWAGRMDEFEPVKTTDAPNLKEIYSQLETQTKDYPYETLIFDTDSIQPELTAIASALGNYLPQLAYGQFDDPASAISKMRADVKAAGWDDAVASLQKDMDTWAQANGLK